MVDLTSIGEGLVSEITSLAENPLATGIAGAIIGAGITAGAIGLVSSAKKKSSKRKTSKKGRGRARDRKFKSKQKHEQRYKRKRKYKIYGRKGYHKADIKRKSKSKRGIHYTKNGQPYKLLANGQARFIKR